MNWSNTQEENLYNFLKFIDFQNQIILHEIGDFTNQNNQSSNEKLTMAQVS